MSLLTPEIEAFVGVESEVETACDVVECGAIRRFAQASMDTCEHYSDTSEAGAQRYGRAVAPPLFPMTMFRNALGTPDTLLERAADPEFDGIVGSTAQGLPPLPVDLALLNAGTDVEFYRYAQPGDTVKAKSRYEKIFEKEGRAGPMLFVVISTDYFTGEGDLLLRVKKTQIRR